MPCGILAVLLMPLGLQAWPLRGMGTGIHVMLRLAHDVSAWPGAVTHVPSLPTISLILAGFGALWIILWRMKWRRLGLIPIFLGAIIACFHPRPDILVSEDGARAGVRLSDGSLAVTKIGKRDFTVDEWNKLNGSRGVASFPSEGSTDGERLNCTQVGCFYKIKSKLIGIIRDPAAAPDFCREATVVISPFTLQTECGASLVIDPDFLQQTGAVTMRFTDTGYFVSSAAQFYRRAALESQY